MDNEIIVELNQKQKLAKQYWQDDITTELWYWWWAGWGKSYLWVILQRQNRWDYPWTRWFFWRKELKRLKTTTLASYYKFLREYNIPKEYHWVLNAQDWVIRFPNWSEILLLDLAYQPSDPLYERFWSLELTDWFIDESSEVDYACIEILWTRVGRWRNEEYWLLPKLLQTFNPNKWHIYRTFYLPDRDWKLPEHRKFIKALVTDNPKISKLYITQLERASPVTQQRLLYGNFDYDATPWRLMEYDAILWITTNPKVNGTKYITCDVARLGKDKTIIRVWDWWEVVERIEIGKSTLDVVWNKILELSQKYTIPMRNIIVDEDGVWWWVVDQLKCVWFVNNSSPIDSRTSLEKEQGRVKPNYQNLKTQCTFLFADKVNASVVRDIYLNDQAIEELDCLVEVDIDKDWPKKIISKEDIKKKLGRSPDDMDSMIMRMYFELKTAPESFLYVI